MNWFLLVPIAVIIAAIFILALIRYLSRGDKLNREEDEWKSGDDHHF